MPKAKNEPKKCWAFDFDNTITKNKTPFIFDTTANLKDKEILENIRNPDDLREFIISQCDGRGDLCVLVTHNSDFERVARYLKALLGEKWQQYFQPGSIQCCPQEADSLPVGKNGYIYDAFKALKKNIKKFGKKNIILIDDHEENLNCAKSEGFKTVWADPKIDYIPLLEKIVLGGVIEKKTSALPDFSVLNSTDSYKKQQSQTLPSLSGSSKGGTVSNIGEANGLSS